MLVVPSPHVCAADDVECSFEDNTPSYFSDSVRINLFLQVTRITNKLQSFI